METETTETAIKLRWIDVDSQTAIQALLLGDCSSENIRERVLANLGITRKEGQSFLAAWTLAMARENGLPETMPAVPALARVVAENPDVMRFAFFLA